MDPWGSWNTKPQAQVDYDCLVSALWILGDLETKNYNLQEYSGLASSQHLCESLAKSVEILSCKSCSKVFSGVKVQVGFKSIG